MMKHAVVTKAGGLIVFTLFIFLQVSASHAVTAANYQQRYAKDLQTIQSSRLGLAETINFIDSHPEIFPTTKVDGNDHPLNRDQRMFAWQTWQHFLDHILFFDSMGHMYAELYLDANKKKDRKNPFLPPLPAFSPSTAMPWTSSSGWKKIRACMSCSMNLCRNLGLKRARTMY